jgi:hypothetical protein
MSSESRNDRKRKPTEDPEAVVANDGQSPKENKKARKVSLNAAAPEMDASVSTEGASTRNSACVADVAPEVSRRRIHAWMKDLHHSNNVKVNVALNALHVDLKNKEKCDMFTFSGGCHALVHLMKDRLKKATDKIQAYDQVTKLNEHAELKTLYKSLRVIISLTFMHDLSKDGITRVGGVEAVVKTMEKFPKCQALQLPACNALINLTACNISNKKAVKEGEIKVLLAALKNHLSSVNVCERACWALRNIVTGSKENAERLITMGGAATVDEVSIIKWPDNDKVQLLARRLATMLSSRPGGRSDSESFKVAAASKAAPIMSSQPDEPTIAPQSGVARKMSSEFATASPKVPAMSSDPREDSDPKPTGTPDALVGSSDHRMSSKDADASPKSLKRPPITSQHGDDRKRKPKDTPYAEVSTDDRRSSEVATAYTEVPTMSTQSVDDHKRKQTDTPDAVVGSDDHRSSKVATASTGSDDQSSPEFATASTEVATMSSQPADPTMSSQPGYGHKRSVEVDTASKEVGTSSSQPAAPTISSQSRDDRKRNTMETPEGVVTCDQHSPRGRTSQRVCKDIFASSITSPQTNAPVAIERASTAHVASSPIIMHEESASYTEPPEEPIQGMWTLIRDLNHPDTAKVDAALKALIIDLVEDSTIWNHFAVVGSCFAAVQLTKLVVKEAIRWISEE